MRERYSIGELARAAGVPSSTLRYYERSGLLTPAGRTGGNYRYYTGASLERLRFIRTCQEAGFPLRDVGALLALRRGTDPRSEVRELVRHRLAEIDARLHGLRRVSRHLRAALARCEASRVGGECAVLEELRSRTGPLA